MADQHKNFAYSTVITPPSPVGSGTSLVVGSGNGTLFPTPPFNATVWPVNTQPLLTNAEIVRVTAINSDTFTIVRAQEGSAVRSMVVGDQIAATVTAKTLTDVESKGISVTVAPNGISADYNTDGESDQTEINEAITAVNAAGGGTVLLRSGTYTCTQSVILLSKVILQGEGIGSTIIKCANSSNCHLVKINTVTDVTVRDLEVNGNKANNPTQTGQNIRIGHDDSVSSVCDNITIENVYTHDAGLHGLITAYDSSVQNGLLSLINVRSDNNGNSADGSGIYINGFETVSMVNCYATGNQLDGFQWKTSNHLQLTNCHSHDNDRYGFFAVDGHANVTSISSYNNGQFGFYVQGGGVFDGTSNSTVNLQGADIYFNNSSGVRFEDVDGCSLDNVRSYNNGQGAGTFAGLHIIAGTGNTSNHHRVSNSAFYDDQTVRTQDFGIWGSGAGTVDLNLVTDCDLYNNSSTQFRQDTWASTNTIDNVVGANPNKVRIHGTLTSSKNFDRLDGHIQTFTLSDNLTVTLTSGKQRGDLLTFIITQDGSGGHTITWPSNFKKAGGTLTVTATASAVDEVTMIWDGTNWRETSRSLNLS